MMVQIFCKAFMNRKLLGVGALVLFLIGLSVLLIPPLLMSRPDEVDYSTIPLNQIKGLNDCQLFAIETNNTRLYVVRCPNSDTSVHWVESGKKYFVNTSS